MKVGFIGLGIMGKPMAKNLLKAGYQVCVNDFHKEAVEELVAAGATAGANNAEVAKGVDVVITMVPNSPNVRAALLGENGVAEGADKDTVVIDMSSIDPVESKKIAAELKAKKKAVMEAKEKAIKAFEYRKKRAKKKAAAENAQIEHEVKKLTGAAKKRALNKAKKKAKKKAKMAKKLKK